MQTIKVNFGDFWPGFSKEENYFTNILRTKYIIELSDDPDFYFFTHPYNGKRDYLKYKCHRIFLGWENERADWNICDYVLDSDFVEGNPRHKRYPIWAGWNMAELTKPKQASHYLLDKKFWGQGLATEAALAIVQYAFEQLNLSRLICLIDPDNAASINVAQRIGMHFEQKVDGIDGDNFPTLIYSIHKSEPNLEQV